MDVKIYIDNTLIDYSHNKALPFELRVAYRDFRKIGETEAIDIVNAASSLIIPATKTNKQIFEGNERQRFKIDVIRNAQNFFSGYCKLNSKEYARTELISYSLELYGGTADIFERLDGLSLRELDLGQITYDNNSVTNSWVGLTSDSNDAIFLPSIYGQLNSRTADYFELEDMRPSVYYETILKGVEDYLSITIESNLRGSDFWKRCVHLYGAGNLWENTLGGTVANNQTSDGTVNTLTYTAPVAYPTIYKVEVNVPAGNNAANDLYHLEINSSTGYNQYILYDTANGNDVVSAEITINTVGQTITLTGHKTGGSSLANLPNGTQFLVRNTTKVIAGSSVEIASCLQDISVKDWLKDIFLQFNLVSFYNPVTKTLRLDPAFPFSVNGTAYDGFYLVNSTPITVKSDNRDVSKQYAPIYDKMTFHYLKDEATEDLINQYTEHNTHPLNCCDIELNDNDNETDFISLYENVSNGAINGITVHELPILVDSDVKLQDGAAAVLEPTFLTNPKNALVTGEIFSGYYEGANITTMPIARQNNLRTYKDYTLTFSDCEGRSGATTQTNEGLISLFYKRYFSILSRLEMLTMTIEISNVIDINTFRSVYRIENENYILIELKKVVYDSNLCEGVFVRLDYIWSTDDLYHNHNPSGVLQILNIQ